MAQNDFKPAEKDSNLIAAISCFFGSWIALVIYLLKKDDPFVRFWSLQAFLFDICAGAIMLFLYILTYVLIIAIFALGAVVAAFTGGLGGIISFFAPFLGIGMIFLLLGAYFLFKLYLAYLAFNSQVYRIPYVGAFVEKHL
jgi:uncharacterized membrane protein